MQSVTEGNGVTRRRSKYTIEFRKRVLDLAERYERGEPLFADDELLPPSDLPMPRMSDVSHRVGCVADMSFD